MADDNSSRHERSAVLLRLITAVAFSLGIGAAIYTFGVYGKGLDPSTALARAGGIFASLCTFGLASVAWSPVSRRYNDEASRARLHKAERKLEESLRVSTTAYAGFVRGSVEQPATHGDDKEPEDLDELLGPLPPDEMPASRDLTLSHLWAVTNARLDLYHEIATRQAQQSFRNAQAAMVIGFLLLAAFVTVAFKASTTTGAVVAGGLGAVSAALSGYVSRTFVKSQETAAEHLKAYFDQPLEFARYLTAERLITEAGLTEDQRREAVLVLVKGLAAPPGAVFREASDQQKAQ
ncbi:hypothetical protein [Streptomyces sp. NPDC046984]|uniref:TRADD-N-associated membrane domain-containing protein n=1 Tax=unclassified Streptomyces TaxID=2593676 RepID=UPI0033C8865B